MHMCYVTFMATSTKPASVRTVVLLSPTERKKLDRLRTSEKASTGEVIRRSIRAYEPENSAVSQEALDALVLEMNKALDQALRSVRSARKEIQQNLKKIEEIRTSHA